MARVALRDHPGMSEVRHIDGDRPDLSGALEVVDRVDRGRYELRREGEVLSFAEHRLEGDVLVIPYVETDPTYRGQGLSAHLLDRVVADAQRRGLRIRPTCSYAASVLRSRPDAADVLERR
jgi:uncharacterized protein